MKDDRGAAYVEFIVAIVPMLTLFWGMLQINGLLLADLVVRNAAENAVRAAIVCDSDQHTSGLSGATECAQQAAEATTKPIKSIEAVAVYVEGASASGNEPVTVTVAATYHCKVPLVGGIACGFLVGEGSGGVQSIATIQRKAALPNQGHYYAF